MKFYKTHVVTHVFDVDIITRLGLRFEIAIAYQVIKDEDNVNIIL